LEEDDAREEEERVRGRGRRQNCAGEARRLRQSRAGGEWWEAQVTGGVGAGSIEEESERKLGANRNEENWSGIIQAFFFVKLARWPSNCESIIYSTWKKLRAIFYRMCSLFSSYMHFSSQKYRVLDMDIILNV
jgi:hypothetical protein